MTLYIYYYTHTTKHNIIILNKDFNYLNILYNLFLNHFTTCKIQVNVYKRLIECQKQHIPFLIKASTQQYTYTTMVCIQIH